MELENFLSVFFAGILLFGVNLPEAGAVTQKERREAIAEARKENQKVTNLLEQDRANVKNLAKFTREERQCEGWAAKWAKRSLKKSEHFKACMLENRRKAENCRNIAISIREKLFPCVPVVNSFVREGVSPKVDHLPDVQDVRDVSHLSDASDASNSCFE
jgi:hypothetical protein